MQMTDKIGNVWVFIEQEGGKIADVSLELVCKATELAKRLNVKTEAVILGNKLEKVIDPLFHYGCDNVFMVEHPGLEPFTVLPFADLTNSISGLSISPVSGDSKIPVLIPSSSFG